MTAEVGTSARVNTRAPAPGGTGGSRSHRPRPGHEPGTGAAALEQQSGVERAKQTAAAMLIAAAGRTFGASLDLAETLRSIGELVVGWFADWCIVDLIDVDGRPRRMSVAAADARDADIVRRLGGITPAADRPSLAMLAQRDRTTVLVDAVTDEHLRAVSSDEAHLELLRSMRLASYIAVPLVADADLLGSIVIGTRHGRIGPEEARVAHEIATLAAVAIQNAQRYERARRALDARDDRLAIVAHDLRAPLATALFAAGLLRLRAAEAGIEGFDSPINVIHRCAEQMARLIDDLTDAAGLQSGRFSVTIAQVSAAVLIREAVDAFTPAAEAGGIALTMAVDAAAGELPADRSRLLQALSNLIANALQFTEAGGRIRVAVERVPGALHFSVEDSGRGIPAELIEHAFEPFWRHDGGERRGLGLGLAIVKSIVEAHGGRVWIESEVGRGTAVHIVLSTA